MYLTISAPVNTVYVTTEGIRICEATPDPYQTRRRPFSRP